MLRFQVVVLFHHNPSLALRCQHSSLRPPALWAPILRPEAQLLLVVAASHSAKLSTATPSFAKAAQLYPNGRSPSSSLPTFDALHHRDRSSVDVHLDLPTFRQWLRDLPAPEGEPICEEEGLDGKVKLILFSSNSYLGLSSHPTQRKAASEAARDYERGPRGSALICGYTDYHRVLEAALADLKKKQDCLVCPTGFAANMAFMSTLGSVSSFLAVGRKRSKDERVAIFSDALNHASIIDGIRLAEQQQEEA